MYRQKFSCIETRVQYNEFYTIIFANYNPLAVGNYKAVFEGEAETVFIEEIKPEGYGLHQTAFDVLTIILMNSLEFLGWNELWRTKRK